MTISDKEENPVQLWAEIWRLRAEIAGPDGYATWKDAAVAERLRKTTLPNIETVSDAVHEAWIESKRAQGITSRKSESGEELMVSYAALSEAAKDLDRGSVQAVYAAINACRSIVPRYPWHPTESGHSGA